LTGKSWSGFLQGQDIKLGRKEIVPTEGHLSSRSRCEDFCNFQQDIRAKADRTGLPAMIEFWLRFAGGSRLDQPVKTSELNKQRIAFDPSRDDNCIGLDALFSN
jgi:hypothetical protein